MDREFISSSGIWLDKIIALLNHHIVHPLNSNRMFVVQMCELDQDVMLTEFQQFDPTVET